MTYCDRSVLRVVVESGVDDPPIWRQCAFLGLSRSTYYYTLLEEGPFNLELMRLMDEQYLKALFYGVGQMTYFLRLEGHNVNQKRVRRAIDNVFTERL